jgi:hypothetical protein
MVLAGQVAVVASSFPVLAGLLHWAGRDRGFRWLWIWLAFGFVLNIVMWVMGAQSQRTTVLVQLTYPIFAILGLGSIAVLAGSRPVAGWCALGVAAYLPFWLWRLVQREADGNFSVYTGPVLWMMLTLGAIALIVARLRESAASPLRDPVVIVGFAVLISYAPGAALEPLSDMLYASHRDLTFVLWIARSCLVTIGSLLFTLAFAWTLPPRLSPGSPSSAA